MFSRRSSRLGLPRVVALVIAPMLLLSARSQVLPAPQAAAASDRYQAAETAAISCTSPGNCAAIGTYLSQPFVVRQARGVWSRGTEVPGILALDAGSGGLGVAISCRSAGNCSAGGTYGDRTGHSHGFVVTEVRGRWREAKEIPGLAALDVGVNSSVTGLSCGAAGNCSVIGSYTDEHQRLQAFVANQAGGAWGRAEEIPGIGALDTNPVASAQPNSVSCPAPGNCVIVGIIWDDLNGYGFMVSEHDGSWGSAQTAHVPGTVASADLDSVSCASVGSCTAGGDYWPGSGQQALVISEVNGIWHEGSGIPGLSALDKGREGQVLWVSCPSAGDCSAGGSYLPVPYHGGPATFEVFVARQVAGAWTKAIALPGTRALSKGYGAAISGLSCGAPGNCSAAGLYFTGLDDARAFVANEVRGSWRWAQPVSFASISNAGPLSGVDQLSCVSAGSCSAAGGYIDGTDHVRAFVVTEKSGVWGRAREAF